MQTSQDAKKTSIIVLNWNGYEDTRACLQSLRTLDYSNYDVIVVDNASSDGSEDKLRFEFPEATVLQSGANRGFAGGNNVGIRHAVQRGAEYVWLLNNDARSSPHALSGLISRAEEDPRIGAVGSRIYHLDRPETLQEWGGGWVNVWTGRSSGFAFTVPESQLAYITGASLLLRRAALEAIGYLDEGYFLYFEDADLGLRLRRGGWKLAVSPDSVVWHRRSASSRRVPRLVARYRTDSLLRFLRLHSPAFVVSGALATSLRLVSCLVHGNFADFGRIAVDTLAWGARQLRPARDPAK